jgi:hypothetical protein
VRALGRRKHAEGTCGEPLEVIPGPRCLRHELSDLALNHRLRHAYFKAHQPVVSAAAANGIDMRQCEGWPGGFLLVSAAWRDDPEATLRILVGAGTDYSVRGRVGLDRGSCVS